MEFIQHIERVISRFDPPPIYSPAVQSERDALEAEIARDRITLEKLRIRETGLRAALVSELERLAFSVKRAAFKISTRQWEDGNPALDYDIERMHQAAEALTDCTDDIAHTLVMIEDQQNDLDDEGLWKEEKQA